MGTKIRNQTLTRRKASPNPSKNLCLKNSKKNLANK
jgi:hypothetical protein